MKTFAQFHFGLMCILFLGCAAWSPPSSTIKNEVKWVEPKPTLYAGMTDEEILGKLGIAAKGLESEFYQGPDGYSHHYEAEGKWSVIVTRSIVTGVFVMESTPTGSRTWKLGRSS